VPGVIARLVDAGHILSSAAVILDIDDHGHKKRLWFSGDKPHCSPELAYDELRQVVSRTVPRGGKVIIPSFAVGRTQELVYDLHQMMDKGEIPRIPVIVDSPLAINASDIFRAHPECFDESTREFIRQDRHKAALGFDKLTYTRSVEESKALNNRKDPMVIISAHRGFESHPLRRL